MPLIASDWERLQRTCGMYRLNLGGIHHRNRIGERAGLGTGSAIEFQEHRAYQPGDDLRRLDWAAYARSGQMVIRLERQEVMPQLDLTIDLSRSMWGLTPRKRQLFEEAIAAVLILAERNALDIRCLLAGDHFHLSRAASPMETIAACEKAAGEGRRTLVEHLDLLGESRRRHASQIIISDLLFEHDPVMLSRRLASGTSPWAILQVLDEEDPKPTMESSCIIQGCEDGVRLDLNLDESVVTAYHKAFQQHCGLWQEQVLSIGGMFVQMTTSRSLEESLLSEWTPAGIIEPR